MRCYVNNPHSFDMLATPVSYWLTNKRAHKKYEQFFTDFLNSGGLISIDFSETSFGRIPSYLFFLRPLIILEVFVWVLINKIPFKVISFFPQKSSNILLFTYKGATEITRLKRFHLGRACRIFWHLSHYMISTQKKSDFIKSFESSCVLVADSDISQNPLFQRYFSFYNQKRVALLTFIPDRRFLFTKRIPDRRQDKVFATGTYHVLPPGEMYDDARMVFGRDCHHFLRSEIASMPIDWIENGQGDFSKQKGIGASTYFDRDLVDTFNDFSFIVCGDELNGLPAISNLEAMCCGALPIVLEDNYKGLGLKKGVHYLTHDGTIEGVGVAISNARGALENGLSERLKVRDLLQASNNRLMEALFV